MGDKLTGVEALSPRQREILRLIAKHLQAKQVANILKISERTVKTHTGEARKKLGVATSLEAARILVEYEARLARQASNKQAQNQQADEETIVLEGRGPSRTMDKGGDDLPASDHGRYIYPETTVLPGPLERAGGRLEDAGGPVEAGSDRGDTERRKASEPPRHHRKGNLFGDRRDRLADRRRDEFERQLRAINVPQWLGLIVLVAVMSALMMGGLITSAQGTLIAIQKLNLHPG